MPVSVSPCLSFHLCLSVFLSLSLSVSLYLYPRTIYSVILKTPEEPYVSTEASTVDQSHRPRGPRCHGTIHHSDGHRASLPLRPRAQSALSVSFACLRSRFFLPCKTMFPFLLLSSLASPLSFYNLLTSEQHT